MSNRILKKRKKTPYLKWTYPFGMYQMRQPDRHDPVKVKAVLGSGTPLWIQRGKHLNIFLLEDQTLTVYHAEYRRFKITNFRSAYSLPADDPSTIDLVMEELSTAKKCYFDFEYILMRLPAERC